MPRYRGSQNKFGGYRGRPKSTIILRRMILVLLILLALLGGLYYWLTTHMEYTPDGQVKLDLSWLQPGSGPAESEPPAAPTATPDSAETPPPPTETPEPITPANGPVRAVEVTVDEVLAGTAAAKMEAAGGNALLLTMKDENGRLYYASHLEVSQELLAVAEKRKPREDYAADPAINAALQQLDSQGIYLVARVECFRDEIMPYYDMAAALKTNSGYRWTDPDKLHWVDPTSEIVRNYLQGVARELASLGFDELVLTGAAYPTEGNLHYIKVGSSYPKNEENGLTMVLDQFLESMAVALSDLPVKLSVETEEGVLLNGANEKSGQTAAMLASHAWRVWVRAGEAGAADLSQGLAGMTQPGQGVVLMSAMAPLAAPEDQSWAQAGA
ncbi:MAG: hypothetical protein HFF18_08285 [Oscillospiraceae bacterium]|nr:hypothetical protein [Oscillospiraceae bacterium]